MTIGVLLVEDQRLVREILRAALAAEPGMQVAGEAGSGREACDLARLVSPDVIVLDLILPDMSGIEVATRVLEARPAQRIVALSADVSGSMVSDALEAGIMAYVTKNAAAVELVRAIRSVAGGERYMGREASAALAGYLAERGRLGGTHRLALRERQVLRLVANGLRTREIAQQLRISGATVEVHRRNIMRKLGVRTVAELTKYAIREKLTAP